MAKNVKSYNRFIQGIADFDKEGLVDSFAFSRCIDHNSDPRKIKLNPRTVKESGSVVTDLILWGEQLDSGSVYMYGNGGNIYLRSSAGSYSALRSVSNSHGNGLGYFKEDDFLYYTADKTLGRYGPISGTPTFNDDFLTSQGGTRLNTYSADLEASSSQYASRADTASLSITGNLSIECYIKPESLPAASNSMTLVSKWDESGATRSYEFDIYCAAGAFGDGSDGALTISSNTTEAPIDSACTGTIATYSLSATNASFAANQKILIHQTRGTGAGTYQINKILAYTAGTITLEEALNAAYVSGAQVRVLKQYTTVTVNAGVTWTAKAWDGTVGGILAFLHSGTVTVNGTISANGGDGSRILNSVSGGGTGGGFRGGNGSSQQAVDPITYTAAYSGEGTVGASTQTYSANGNGGGGADQGIPYNGSFAPGGGGGNGTAGQDGHPGHHSGVHNSGKGGTVAGSADLTTIVFGGGGGGGVKDSNDYVGGGGSGGGIIFIQGTTFTMGAAGSITATGGNGGGALNVAAGGGGGAGGSILIRADTITLGTNKITASGGTGGTGYTGFSGLDDGGNGGDGRIHVDYYTSYTGTTIPTVTVNQDNSLVANTSYYLRLAVSSTGSNSEVLSRPVGLVVDIWKHVAVTWTASTSTATFYLNGNSLGTSVGALTAIHNNASTFQIGMYKDGAGAATSFYDGKIDDVRVWAKVLTSNEINLYKDTQISTTSALLKAYYLLNNDWTDSTANANNLTASGSPTFGDDVPFFSPTTRLDIDQSATTTSQTYTLTTAISETATNKKTFTPAKDPQKSIGLNIDTVGTGNWTVTIHDAYNIAVASLTVATASLNTGWYEFVFSSVWRPQLNQDYHFHVTSTVADGIIVTGTLNDLSTVSYKTYFQFLVEDTNYHPIAKMLNFLVVGNERYVAKYEATLWYPNQITLPSEWRIRCFGYWREYLAIGCYRGSNIYDYDRGRIYFWDGISEFYNTFIDVPEGGINSMVNSRGKLYVIAGYQGDLLEYQGGDSAVKVKRLPKVTPDKYVETYPQAMTMWKTYLHYAASNSDGDVERGVYSYGAPNLRYDDSLSFDHIPSTGNYASTVKIGMCMVVNKKLLVSYQDNTAYGVDYVDSSNSPYPTGTLECLIFDDGKTWKEKEAISLVSNFLPLSSGESVDLKYKVDRASSWTMMGAVTTANLTKATMQIPTNTENRYREIQVGIVLNTTTTTSPEVTNLTLESEGMETETRI